MKIRYDIVLPKQFRPFWDKKKSEWTMRVRLRGKTEKKYTLQRIYLGLGADASMEQIRAAYDEAKVRLTELGAGTKTYIQKKRKIDKGRYKTKFGRESSRDRNYGIKKIRPTVVKFLAHIPDPLVDGKKIACGGRFETLKEAREARNAKYREVRFTRVVCAICGAEPKIRPPDMLTHMEENCPNKVQLPSGVRPLLQSKLWNLIFSKGGGAGRLTKEDLHNMGFFYRPPLGGRLFPRLDVEFDFSLAKNYVRNPEPEEPEFH